MGRLLVTIRSFRHPGRDEKAGRAVHQRQTPQRVSVARPRPVPLAATGVPALTRIVDRFLAAGTIQMPRQQRRGASWTLFSAPLLTAECTPNSPAPFGNDSFGAYFVFAVLAAKPSSEFWHIDNVRCTSAIIRTPCGRRCIWTRDPPLNWGRLRFVLMSITNIPRRTFAVFQVGPKIGKRRQITIGITIGYHQQRVHSPTRSHRMPMQAVIETWLSASACGQ